MDINTYKQNIIDETNKKIASLSPPKEKRDNSKKPSSIDKTEKISSPV